MNGRNCILNRNQAGAHLVRLGIPATLAAEVATRLPGKVAKDFAEQLEKITPLNDEPDIGRDARWANAYGDYIDARQAMIAQEERNG
jgi:hypothetical protein